MTAAATLQGTSVSGELRRIVAANEQIKAIISMAFQIRLTALNAMLLSRRAGALARGFGVLSRELRNFAAELSGLMGDLHDLTGRSVSTVTSLVKEARLNGILERVPGVTGPAVSELDNVRAQHAHIVSQQTRTLIDVQRQLAAHLDLLRPVVLFGTVLVRSARIEGAYGGDFARQLSQVAASFGQAVSAISDTLDGLHKRMQEIPK